MVALACVLSRRRAARASSPPRPLRRSWPWLASRSAAASNNSRGLRLFCGRRVDDAKRQLTPLHAGLLLHDARPLAHDGQLYYRCFQRGVGLVRLLVARVMEAYGECQSQHFILWTPRAVESRKFHSLVVLYLGLQQGALPRTHRLPRQGGRIGQGRRRVLGARHEYRRRPGLLRSPATKWGVDPREVSRTGLPGSGLTIQKTPGIA